MGRLHRERGGFLPHRVVGPYFDGAAEDRTDLRFLLVTGFCGGFTTFSAFSMDTLKLLRDSQPLLAGANVALHLACCLAAAFAGWQLARPAG